MQNESEGAQASAGTSNERARLAAAAFVGGILLSYGVFGLLVYGLVVVLF